LAEDQANIEITRKIVGFNEMLFEDTIAMPPEHRF